MRARGVSGWLAMLLASSVVVSGAGWPPAEGITLEPGFFTNMKNPPLRSRDGCGSAASNRDGHGRSAVGHRVASRPGEQPAISLFGVPVGAPMAEMVRQAGPPDGRIELAHGETWLVYRDTALFLFRDNRLAGVRMTGGVGTPGESTGRNRPAWRLASGIIPGMTLEEVRLRVGHALVEDSPFQASLDTPGCRIRLLFSPGGTTGTGPRVTGVVVLTGDGVVGTPAGGDQLPAERR